MQGEQCYRLAGVEGAWRAHDHVSILSYSVLDNIPFLQWMNKMIAQDFDLDSALSLNQKMPYGHLSLVYESNYVSFQEIVC